jgi:hypothetical protein
VNTGDRGACAGGSDPQCARQNATGGVQEEIRKVGFRNEQGNRGRGLAGKGAGRDEGGGRARDRG